MRTTVEHMVSNSAPFQLHNLFNIKMYISHTEKTVFQKSSGINGIFPKWIRNSENSANSGNLINC